MQAIKLGKKYPDFKQDEIFDLINKFKQIDVDDKGSLDKATVISALQANGEADYDSARETLKNVNIDSSGRVELEDWVQLHSLLKAAKNQPLLEHNKGRISVRGTAGTNAQHTINEDERRSFTDHVNTVLAADKDVGHLLPIPTDTMQLFDECRDGLILCKLINDAVPETIDERVLNKPSVKAGKARPLNAFQMTENNNIVITSAKGIGCSVVNIGPQDLIEGREHLILGLIWQIIRRGLLSKIDIKIHPELYRLLEDGETMEEFLRLPPDQILLRWFNYHLKAAGWHRRVENFTKDVSDGENYTILLNQLKPDQCSRSPLQTSDLHKRAEEVLQNADRIGCRRFLTPNSLVNGNPKLNLAFVANLFNTWPGLAPLEETEAPPPIEDFDAEGEREARVFTLWLNSLDVEPGVYNLFEDLKDGTILLQGFDKVIPGSVIWRRVSKPREGQELSRFKAVENTNYSVDLAKANGMHIVGIQGSDIVDGTRTLVLGLVWQLMRLSINQTLASISKDGKGVTDQDIIRWANETVKKGGKTSAMRSFKDSSLSNAVFFLDLLNGVKPGIVDYSLVTQGADEEEKRMNAKLAISIARKMGALIFLVPEDIVDVRPRLILTFVGALWSASLNQ
ncbi:fimbrin [Cryptococcus gattii Ru294]|uniref:Fimbrin n=2 Tax=Cryptococcus gattii TaxID=37769 RepID=E6RC35_CRYGW|nr:Fimbrin, putative [Cryptococcus gattii WM276]KIR54515.1 fimbrin [Cryptococcus gattii Ru294]KIR76374.1 fimbrin [Cryptococcus gattii EJB2]KIY32469.1 fimbrin [Cryptococcus gattii E566]KJE02575.1 fimbrin [Cryptococcus gattii NT-10]ADV24382.1 Fimbrin, putative [Cryptococcus gattii WM276]